jgi:protocatechuate 3,4-dioxygenase, beta subunit
MQRIVNRRGFLAACAALPLLEAPAGRLRQSRRWRIDVVGPKEPGMRIVVAGTIFQPDGRAPAPNVKLFLYQTDAAGWYTRPVNNPRQARLHATLWTDGNGRYEFQTVEPAHYADVNPPPAKHIHVHMEPPGLPDHWVDSYKFAGDPQLTADDIKGNSSLGTYSAIVTVRPRQDGSLFARRDFRTDPELAERNRLVNGWYRQ